MKKNKNLDTATLFGIFIGVGGIIFGNALEGGHLSSLVQFTAFIIVFGGTLGAVLVSNSMTNVQKGFELLKTAFQNEGDEEKKQVAKEIVEASKVARQETLLALESRIPQFTDPFMQKIFRFVVDGMQEEQVREAFEHQIDIEEKRLMEGAKIWTDAGGFSPTIGIIGAVLGLIHVMSNLTDTSQLGKGIAVAFVATIYGVGSANLIFLPIGNKLKGNVKKRLEVKEMIIEGACSIIKGQYPVVVEQKMNAFIAKD